MATNSPSLTVKLISPITFSGPLSVEKLFLMPLTTSLAGIPPPDYLQPLQAAHHAIQQEAGDSDDHHPGYHQVVAVPRVPRIDDQVPEPGPESDHLRRDDDEPGHAEADSHSNDDLRKNGRDYDLAEKLVARNSEIIGGPNILSIDRVHAIGGLHDRRKHRRKENEKNRRQISHAEPEDRKGDPGDGRDGTKYLDERV